VPAGIFSIQTAGDSLNWNPHIHALIPLTCRRPDGTFDPLEEIDTGALRRLFEAFIFGTLLGEGLISAELVDRIRSWKHTGFHVYSGPPLQTSDEVVKVGYYIIRPPASASRLKADAGVLKYLARGGQDACYDASLFDPPGENFDYLDWIARLTSHVPDKGFKAIRYCGFYSSRSRAAARKAAPATDSARAAEVPADSSPDRPSRAQWAALLKKIYECEALICAKCRQKMKVVAIIEKPSVIDRILKHIGYRFEVMPLASPAGRPPPPFLWSAEDFSQS
jgi:hypothetical protein